MSKTIRKIPWAVPGLAMVAVAAFLAIGLLANNGVQPVAAQDADCTVEIAADGTVTSAAACIVQGDMATVEFQGDAAATVDHTLSLLIADPDGRITAYPSGTVWANSQLEDGANNAVGSDAAMKYRYQSITVPKAEANPTTGLVEGQTVSITVKGNVHIWAGTVSVTAAITGITIGDPATGARAIASGATALAITFLGAPAIGVDGDDANSIVDDTIETTVTPPFTDTTESRSKLEAVTGTTTTTVIDGGSADHVLTGIQDEVTITATVQDAHGNDLEDVEVTFTATSDPAGVESSTRVVDSRANGTAPRTISGLPTDSGYRVTVAVSADGVDLGSIVIARSGDLTTFTALICAADSGNTDTDDGCGANSRPQSVFGDVDGTFRIVTTAKDALDSDAGGVSVDSDEDADGIAVGNFTSGVAAGTIVAADAEGGRYPITLTATQGSGDDEISLMAIVDITISGPLAMYDVSGPDRIESGTSQTYTVQALDSLGNPAQFEATQQTTVDVFVEGDAKNSVTVFGVPGGGLDLSDDSEATFRIRAASNAMDGEITIVISGVATIVEATKTVMIGEEVVVPPVLGDASGLMAEAGADAGMVELTWTPGPNATRHFVAGVKQSDLDAGTPGDSLIWTFAESPDSHTVTGLDSGEVYLFVVIAGDADGWGDWTALQMVTPN